MEKKIEDAGSRAAKCVKLNVRSMADEEEDLYGSSDGVAATSSVAPVPAAVAAAANCCSPLLGLAAGDFLARIHTHIQT